MFFNVQDSPKMTFYDVLIPIDATKLTNDAGKIILMFS
jgi:hypothetical protein